MSKMDWATESETILFVYSQPAEQFPKMCSRIQSVIASFRGHFTMNLASSNFLFVMNGVACAIR
jgi:hypothetical protein